MKRKDEKNLLLLLKSTKRNFLQFRVLLRMNKPSRPSNRVPVHLSEEVDKINAI